MIIFTMLSFIQITLICYEFAKTISVVAAVCSVIMDSAVRADKLEFVDE